LFKNLLILFLISFNSVLFAQFEEAGFPLVQNFPPKVYGYESQNFSIAQNDKGIYFISNVSGIIQYDGVHWSLIPAQGIPRLCTDSKKNVYAAVYKDFGIITTGQKNTYEFKSLVPSTALKEKIGDITSLISCRNEILFIGNYSYLFAYNGKNIRVIDSTSNLLELYIINDKLFIFKEPGGLYQYANGNMILWLSSQSLNNKIIDFLIPYYDKFLLKFRNEKNFYILTKAGKIIPFKNEIENYINEHQYSCHIMTPDSIYVFGTYRGGIIGMDTKGHALFELSTDNLLINDNINALFLDKWNNVWAAMNNGLSRIEIYSAFSYFSTVNGVKGGVSDICRFNNKIYLATTQGLRYLDNTFFLKQDVQGNMFKLFKEIKVDCNKMMPTPYGLLLSTDVGLYFINKKEKVQLINSQYIFEDFLALDSLNHTILVGLNNGIGKIEFIKEQPHFTAIHSDLSDHIRTIAKNGDRTYWLGSDYNGTYHVSVDIKNNTAQIINHFKSGKGFPIGTGWIDVYSTRRGVIFSTQKGPYLYNKLINEFINDTLLVNTPNTWIFPLKEDLYKNIWFSSGKEGIYEKETAVAFYKNNKYKIVKNPFKVIREYTIESIFPDSNAVTWFGAFDGLIRFDAKKLTQDTSKLLLYLSSIITGKDTISAFTFLSENQHKLEIEYKNHNIHFEFIAPYFDGIQNIQYQYYLEGFDKHWSDWTTNTFKEYTNLYEGRYVFHVRAKNIYGTISNEVIFEFKILPPIYRTWYAYIIYIVLISSLIIMIFQWRAYLFAKEKHHIETELNLRTKQLAEEKEKVDELIRNFLPEEAVKDLKEKGSVEKKKFSLVSILFADVQGFTHITEQMAPEMLIDELNLVFKNFDDICDLYGVEKIKTIGDAYMCAGGVPKKNRTNPIDVTLVALKMQDFIKNNKHIFRYQWSIRIGIHSGSVVAGVVGSKKFSYDIWGDAVNIASRMESSSIAGEINISGDVYGRIKDYFICEYRGKLPVKHKGEIDMYFVKGIRPDMANPDNPNEPNDKFKLKRQFLIYDDLEEFVLTLLEKKLPKNLYYHDVKHTIDVITQVEMLALGEKVNREELLMLKTAALLHDSGFISGNYDEHEEQSVKFAREILPQYNYRQDQIDTICRLILATKFPPQPKDLLESIICDADLDYLGRSDFIPVSQNLFRELYEQKKIRSLDEWNKLQYEFIRKHQYFTETAKRKRNTNKTKQLDELNKIL